MSTSFSSVTQGEPAVLTQVELKQVRSILVIQFRYLGDMVLLSSLFYNLHLHLPDARLAALADEAYTEILQNVPDLDEIIVFPRKQTRHGAIPQRLRAWFTLVRKLRSKRFDMVIDVANTSTSRALVSLSGAPWRVGYRPTKNLKGRVPYNIMAQSFTLEVPHFMDHYLEPLNALGLPIVERTPRMRPQPADEQTVRALLHQYELQPGTFAVIHPGARLARKCWPVPNFAQVVDTLENDLGMRSVITGSNNELPMRHAILQQTKAHPVDFVGRLTTGQMLALLRECRIFIGNDSGPMHMAAAAGSPVVALFGPSETRFWSPVGKGHIVIERECHCGLNMKQPTECDVRGPACLQQITLEEVVAAVRQVIKSHERI